MPPHWLHAGPRSRPARRAGTTGGVSVKASAAARVVAGWLPATVGTPGVPAAACGAPDPASAGSVASVVAGALADEALAPSPRAPAPVVPPLPLPPLDADGPAV